MHIKQTTQLWYQKLGYKALSGFAEGLLSASLTLKEMKEPHSHETQCHADNLYLSIAPAR
jgi:hypothetical protein